MGSADAPALGGGVAQLSTLALPATFSALACQAAAATRNPVAPPNGFPEWNNNIAIFDVGSEPPHATLMPYADLPQALTGDRTSSPYRQSLDGDWKFQHADRPDAGRRVLPRRRRRQFLGHDPGSVELAAARQQLPGPRMSGKLDSEKAR